jgi:hypothetical protein
MRGFPIHLLRNVGDDCDDSDDCDDDDTWWEEGLLRVFDPYFDVTPDEIESVEGKRNADGRDRS